ncbi:sensor histidine kinase [Puniceibacterium sediminis]|uniref:histidine kinase n=1 Tax=Puniceibacterium sediminis TaxID=1608407 RepID=A0A238WZG5_9RHOB|nr:HAMP domain-containing sensor histidine kinase [Puniceibacterium sediminis]SNR51614.1 Histidine kinase-, DNA gyrase B-, and HSP90-like ATPase [Puniceibacterium sediminis]
MEMQSQDLHANGPNYPLGNTESELDEIMYRISHDLRASVRALQELPCWIVEDLEEAAIQLPGKSARHLKLLSSHATRLDAMLSGLLEYSRVGRMQQVELLNPSEILQDVLEDISISSRVTVHDLVADQLVRMGETDLKRVFAILVGNAIGFHPTHSPEIVVKAQALDSVNWQLEVTDDGPGIPEEVRHLIFMPMSKLVSRDQEDGAGMGLAILKKIVRTYGGKVDVRTAASGKGTTFTVILPVLSSTAE